MDLIRSKIAATALLSRLAILALSIVANLLIPDHDAGVFQWQTSSDGGTLLDSAADWLTDGLCRWDGQYHLHVADQGYTYEHTLAFFPLYPTLVRWLANGLYWMQVDYGLLNYASLLKISAILVSGGCFVGAALQLFELSRRVLKDDYLAYRAALLFCLNPASIFFSAAYAESLHALLAFSAMLRLERCFSLQAGMFLAAAGAARANAVLNAGFALYKGFRAAARELAIHRRLRQLERAELSETVANLLGDAVMPAFTSALAAFLPFAAFQWYGFTHYCGLTRPLVSYKGNVVEYALRQDYKLPTEAPSPWCESALPLPYAYVQAHHWNVGFLKYWQLKQLPNFLLAAPVLTLVLWQCWRYARAHPYYAARLGCAYFRLDPAAPRAPAFDPYQQRALPRDCLVYVVHAAFLCFFSLLCVHVQIATRLIASSSPVLYWAAALLTVPAEKRRAPAPSSLLDLSSQDMACKLDTRANLLGSRWRSSLTEERGRGMDREGRWVLVYFGAYAVVGTVLFANWLPWT